MTKTSQEALFVGVDVSKATLAVALDDKRPTEPFPNNDQGIAALLARLQTLPVALLLMEATGCKQLCRVFDISRSWFQETAKRAEQPVAVCPFRAAVQQVFEKSGKVYGSRRIRAELRAQGLCVGRYRMTADARIGTDGTLATKIHPHHRQRLRPAAGR